MKVVVFGATGKAGRAVALTLLAAGHQVTAFGRSPAKLPAQKGISMIVGDAMNAVDVASAVAGQDAVVVSLGDSLNPVVLKLGARLGVKRNTHPNICEVGTANVIAAMAAASVKRLICTTAYGVGDTRDRLSPLFRLWFRVLQLGEQLADKERQETLVKDSGLDWTLIQPVGLTDGAATGRWLASTSGDRRKRTVSRVDLADFIAQVLEGGGYVRETVVLSQLAISERDFATNAV
ncbi:putative NADH-flavin reductase [Thiocystis violascens DSM 198]|uniref:Putative NADH-flavin reductase n=1 Tax=Thiocystis violascens (strain ATCC 17096 / DSM 198 / 6111) TaxID=765911 RepID=I3YAF7_THIV6|nr:putative NADH-flavin reductase [Thiocystis violascens DSM 198]